MVVFPNCKINLGLHVVEKRPDGFHSIETVFYPVNWCDALEVIENHGSQEPFTYSKSGIPIHGALEENLIFKTWKIISEQKRLPPLLVHLHKNIPMGAGLGGGSSDAAHFINLVDSKFNLGYSENEKIKIASSLGSDCAFFIKNQPVFAVGKGNEFSDIQVDLSDYYLLVVYPQIHSNTKEAYEGLIPKKAQHDLRSVLESGSIKEWKNNLINDFDNTIFKKYPYIQLLKNSLYDSGALYASMSGSGSSVFAIFDKEPELTFPASYSYFLQKPSSKIL